MHVPAAQLLGRDDLAGGRLHQRRAAQEDRALVLDDDRLVGHRGHVGAAGGARAHHRGHLRDALRGERGLVEEDPAEVVAVGEDLVLQRQERAAGVDQVDAGQPVGPRHLLGPQVLLDRHRVVGAALDGGVVGHHHALPARHAADAGDQAGGRYGVRCPRLRRRTRRAVHPGRGQGAQLQEGAAGVEQPVDPVAHQQLAPRQVPLAGGLRPAPPYDGQPGAQVLGELPQVDHRARLAIANLLRHPRRSRR